MKGCAKDGCDNKKKRGDGECQEGTPGMRGKKKKRRAQGRKGARKIPPAEATAGH